MFAHPPHDLQAALFACLGGFGFFLAVKPAITFPGPDDGSPAFHGVPSRLETITQPVIIELAGISLGQALSEHLVSDFRNVWHSAGLACLVGAVFDCLLHLRER